MNSSRGIFEPQEGFAPAPPTKSPFAVDDDAAASSPFAVVSEPESPFAALKDDHPTRLAADPGRPAKLPERRPSAGEEPAAESRSPFAVEASAPATPEASGSSPFASTPPPVPASAPASSPFGFTQETPAEKPAETPAKPAETPAPAPVAAPPATPAAESAGFESDSRSIRQLALRAIFGVDRELGVEEILQRSRALPGIRNVARVPAADSGAIDALKRVVGNLGFGAGPVKLYCGSVPIEFIREGDVLLAVQNDGSFAPGVRETLMIVASELGKLEPARRMTVEQDERQVSVKVALAGAADAGKLAVLRAIAGRHGSASFREHRVGSLRVLRVEWTEPGPLPDGRFLNVAVHSLSGEVEYNAPEELLLRSAAGIVFVVDVDPAKFDATWDSLMRLSDNTARNGYDLQAVGVAIQYHRADLFPDFDPAKLDARLGVPPGLIPRFVSTSREPDAEGMAFDSVMAQIKARLADGQG